MYWDPWRPSRRRAKSEEQENGWRSFPHPAKERPTIHSRYALESIQGRKGTQKIEQVGHQEHHWTNLGKAGQSGDAEYGCHSKQLATTVGIAVALGSTIGRYVASWGESSPCNIESRIAKATCWALFELGPSALVQRLHWWRKEGDRALYELGQIIKHSYRWTSRTNELAKLVSC